MKEWGTTDWRDVVAGMVAVDGTGWVELRSSSASQPSRVSVGEERSHMFGLHLLRIFVARSVSDALNALVAAIGAPSVARSPPVATGHRPWA